MKSLTKRHVLIAGIAFILGALWVSAMRFILYSPDYTHFHANFRVVVDGVQEEFDGFTFYEEISACTADEMSPKSRVHLHQPDNDVVHVHAEGATWGNLFENMGLSLSDSAVQTSDGLFVDGEGGDLVFMLNSRRTRVIANNTINDRDRLLIYFGEGDDASIESEFAAVSTNAQEFNEKDDPATCSGSDSPSFSERLDHVF